MFLWYFDIRQSKGFCFIVLTLERGKDKKDYQGYGRDLLHQIETRTIFAP